MSREQLVSPRIEEPSTESTEASSTLSPPASIEQTVAPAASITPPSGGLPQAALLLPPDTRIGRYHLLEQLGSGGMSVVYTARDPQLGRKVAIKLLRSSGNQARLAREARALAKLAHPNVVTVYDAGVFKDLSFVAMELVDGSTFRSWIEEQPRSWREALEVLMHAGHGLAAAHAARLVHRDFKPDNVLIGKDGRVRVLDFGIVSDGAALDALPDLDAHRTAGAVRGAAADAFSEADAISTTQAAPLTGTGALLGTPAYMAPEQFRSEESDARTDQFSFCVTLWEAVYGERPFKGQSLFELACAVVDGTLPEPPKGHPAPAWLQRILTRGLSVNREARYPSMEALLAAIGDGLSKEEASTRLVGRRYERIEPTPGADRARRERAVDRLTGKVVTLERIHLRRDADAPDSTDVRLALAHAFRDLASLRHPNLVGVLDFGFDHERAPYFVLDLSDATEDLLTAARSQPVSLQLDSLVQLLRALAYLHRHHIALGALPREAVRVTGGQVRLLPLGVAVDPGRVRPSSAAPEVLRDEPATAASDLYAAGLLAFELFAGRPPFGGGPRAAEAPDVSTMDVEPKVAAVIRRMLELDPAARHASAGEVIAALAQAAGRPLAADNAETRESYIQTAPLVGRDAEVTELRAAVLEAMKGHGSAWLIGGESGVGKSRLLEEVRTFAVVQGALVLRGQEQSEGASPYRLFRDALRWLALLGDLDELEAGVLLPIVPDLERLLGRAVKPAPELDAPSMHARLRDVVERVLCRQEQPVVLLLEDLQWSRSDSVKLLQGIYPLARGMSLLIAATYRIDERPGLADDLAGMRPIGLSRLPVDAVAELSAAMIGDAGRKTELVELIQRETEGNAFFVVEVMRALAEEAGGLDRIGTAALPSKVFSGGIRRVVQRRLRQVPEEARALLRTAAVIGRAIDPRLLAVLAPDVDIEEWTRRCVDAVVLEQAGEEVRFAHDKLREGLLAEMSDGERRRLHRQTAEAIEQVYASAPERYAALAHHFGEAGDAAKEVHYAALAGELAVRTGTIPEGMKLLRRALDLNTSVDASSLDRAHCHRLLGEAEFYGGNLDAADRHLTEAMRLLGHAPPRSTTGWIVLIVSQLFVQIALRLASGRASNQRFDARLIEASKAAGRMALVAAHELDGPRVLGLSLFGVNLAERGGGTDICAMAMLGYAAGAIHLRRTALGYFERGWALALAEDRPSDFIVVVFERAMFHAGNGEFDTSVALIREALDAALRIGDRLHTAMAEGGLASIEGLRGHFEARYGRWDTAQSRLDSSYGCHRVDYVVNMADALTLLGRFDEAERALDVASAVSSPSRLAQSETHAARARIHAYRGELGRAHAAADECVRTFKTGTAVAALSYFILEGVADAIFTAWQNAIEEHRPESKALAESGRRLLHETEVWARIYPIGRPLMLVIRGKFHALSGAPQKARKAWREAVRLARALGTPFHEAMAHFELGRLSPTGGEERREHFEEARRLWSTSKAEYHLKRLHAAESADG